MATWILGLLWETLQSIEGDLAVVLFVGWLASRALGERMMRLRWLSRGWALGLISMFFLYSVAREGYEEIEAARLALSNAKLTALLPKEDFYPFSEDVTRSMTSQIVDVADEYGIDQVNIWVSIGNQARINLASQLKSAIAGSGVTTKVIPETLYATGEVFPISMGFPSGGDKPAQRFAFALSTAIKIQIFLMSQANGPEKTINVYIYGDPLFWSDGTVTFRR